MKMIKILTHFIQMDVYEIPIDKLPEKFSNEDILNYIDQNSLMPVSSKTRDWEVVSTESI